MATFGTKKVHSALGKNLGWLNYLPILFSIIGLFDITITAAAVMPKYLFEQSTGARLWELPIAVIKITSDRNWIRTIDALSFEIGMMFDQIEPHALSTVYTLQNVFCFHKRKDFKACSAIVSFVE